MTIPTRWPHTTALFNRLASTGVPTGNGDIPAGAGWQGDRGTSGFKAYNVLHSIPGGFNDGTLASPDDDVDWRWQVTAVGDTPEACEWAADKARTALLGAPLTVTGRNVQRLTVETPDGARRDDTVQPPVFICTERYRLMTTPS